MTAEDQTEIASVFALFAAGEVSEEQRDEAINAIATRGQASLQAALDQVVYLVDSDAA